MIRQATISDAKSVLPIINIVFEEMEMPLFQKIPLQDLFSILEQAFAMPEYRYSYANTLVYEEDGQVLGLVVGFPEEKEAHIDDALAPLFPQIGLPATTRFFNDKEARKGEWYLDTLAVAKHAQGQGVGTKLLKALPTILKERGEKVISLSVDLQNPKAKKLYERMGFVKQGDLMIGSHQYDHMIKTI
ncbi:GNAT family N-acetyltransferase [Latilactobacillus graminis]|uniref:Acetyltransferase, GNAT family n=2 Tax=Latilactobacillus graminis TaxID=60519 RepID=A0AA89I6E6_9LACO|nr:GNAT family N-acetyltransferase [Latilactobacillus graminis]KRM21159.1 acetyltransferase, GNAT family [Latilactobacillus graminis DSM 20719]QFP79286.1 GNAT family N-acetyltransferase [Latilactobacillus graminis]